MPAHNAAVWKLEDVIEDATAQRIEPLYTYADLASALQVSVQTIEVWVKQGRIPSPLYIGGLARFTIEHLRLIKSGVSKPQTFPVSDSPRATMSKAGRHRAKEKKLAAGRKITRKAAPAPRSKGQGAK